MSTMTPILLETPAARGRDLRADALAILAGGVALAGVCGFGLWFVSPSPPPTEVAAAPPPAAAPTGPVGDPFGGLVAFDAAPASAPPAPALRHDDSAAYGSLVGLFPDAAAAPPPSPIVATLEAAPPAADAPPPAVAPDAPLPPKRDVPLADDSIPLPPPRPPQSAALEAPAPTAADQGLGPSRSLGSALAYAAPDAAAIEPAAPAKTTSIFSIFSPQPIRPAGYDDHTAVYDISGRALYMPDGTKIEAHSGLGADLDDPNHVDEHAKGATPPDLYDLQLRESLFHGVAAIRLIPVGGDGAVYGREGLLAHPFMMGDNGDSNGCVSIKDYDAFLKAFQDGKITRLAVVAKI
jgi:hypothetical protein